MNKLFIFLGLFLVLGCVSAIGAVSDLDGLVGYWSFNTDATDDHASYDGVVTNAAHVGSAYCKLGAGCYNYTGDETIHQYITLADYSAEFVNDATLTIWVKLRNDPPVVVKSALVDMTTATEATHYPYTDNNLYINMFRDDRLGPLTGKVAEGTWHLISIRNDADGNYVFWQNNESVYSGTGEVTLQLGLRRLGAQTVTTWSNFDGQMDEMSIWNRSLTDAEILELWNNGSGLAYPFVPPPPYTNFSFINEDPANGSTVFSETLPYQLNLTFNYTSNESTTDCVLTFDDGNITETFDYRSAITELTSSDLSVAINDTEGFEGEIIWANPYLQQDLYLYYDNASILTVANGSNITIPYEIESTGRGYKTTEAYSNDAVAVYHFGLNSSTTSDSTKNNNDGTVNGATWTESGKFGNAFEFDGVNDGIYLGNGKVGTSFTVIGWAKSNNPAANDVLVQFDPAAGDGNKLSVLDFVKVKALLIDSTGSGTGFQYYHGATSIPTDTWYHYAVTWNGTDLKIYYNGSEDTPYTKQQDDVITVTDTDRHRMIGYSYMDNANYFNGTIDEVRTYNRSLSATEIEEMYNNSIPGLNMNLGINSSAAGYNLTKDAVVTETFNVINDTLQINYTFINELNFGLHNFTLNCTDNSFSGEETKQLYLLFDETEPAIMIYAPSTNNDTVVTSYINNLTVNVSVFDENLFNSTINIYYPNGSIYFTNSSFNTSEDWHNFSDTFNLDEEPPHEWILQVRAADGHTKQDIDFSEWDINKNDAEKMIDFGNCAVYPDDINKIEFFDYSCSGDRCTWQYDFKDLQNTRNQFVECDSYMHIMSNEDMTWFVSGNNWIDFENVQGYDVTFTRLNDHKYKVSYHGTDISSIITNSIGELNVAEQNITFTVEHPFIAEETYDNDTVEYIPHTLTMQIINISVEVDTIDNVSIIYDGVTYEADFLGNYTYSYTATDEVLGAAENEEVEHHWGVSLTTYAPVHTHDINTTSINQTAWDYLINKSSEAEAYQTTHFLNVSVYDEITGEPINITVDMNVIFDNGYHNVSKIETYENNQTFSYYIAPDSSVKDMNISLYGSVTLSGTYNNITYVTRTLEVSQGAPIVLSNDGTTYNLNLYAIGVENSTTITFNWKTTGYVDIAGIMRVYRCNPNGTIYVVESLPITGGVATANLELLTAQYAYDVIIDGVVYQQESFFTCHVESLTIRTFFVDVSEVDLAPVIGLYLVDCVLDLVSDTTINMQWTSNPDNAAIIEGCLVGYQNSISGMTEFYRNCSNLSFSLLRTIPDPGGSFYVRGLIYQEGVQGYCREDVTFNRDVNAATQFGATLLFALIFLIMGLALIYAGQTSESLLGAGIAIVVAYVLGLLALSWEWVTMAIAILVIIALLIRYGRDN